MRRVVLLLAMLVGVAVTCAAVPTLTGRVYTQGRVEKVVARLWALGEPVVADPTKAGRSLAESVVDPGQAFAFDLENIALPVRVELAAPGHVGLAFDVLFPEQLTLPPAWLPEGMSVEVHVTEDGKPAAGASVWGRLPEFGQGEEPGRWRTSVPHAETGADGRVTVWIRRDRTVRLWAARGGRWAWFDEAFFSRGELTMRLVSKPVGVKVIDRHGEPVSGARVAAADAPPGIAVKTGDDGRATVPAIVEKDWTLVAFAPGIVGRRVLHGPAKGAVELLAEPVEELEVQWSGAPAMVSVDAEWLPAALRGDAPLVATSPVRLPFLGRGGPVQLWRPGVTRWDATVEDARAPLVACLERAATVSGSVVDAGGGPAAGVPVWSWVTPEWQRRGGRIVVRGSSRAILERASLPWSVSDESGRFSLPDLAAGPAKVSAWRAGQPEAESDDLRLAPATGQQVTLTLENGTWLALTATDPEGRRLAGATVEVRPDHEERRGAGMIRLIGRGDEDAQVAAVGSTDREGRVTVRGVPHGPIGAVLKLSGFVPRTVEAEVPVEGIDLGEQMLEPGVTVQGRVVDERGQGVADAEVVPDPSGMAVFGPGGTHSDAQGYFVLADQARAGELYLSAHGEGFASVAPRLVRLPPQGLVELKVHRTRVLEGRVLARESGEPVGGARVAANRRVERGVGGVMRGMSVSQVADSESDEDGRFRLEGLPPVELSVSVEAPGFRSRSVEVDLGAGTAPRELTAIIERGLSIRGAVTDSGGAPFAGASVQAMPAEGGSGMRFAAPDSARTGADGRFEIDGVAPGRWQLTAEAEGGFRAQEVVEAGGDEVELRLEGGGTIHGRVTIPGGTFPADARVIGWGPGGWTGEQPLAGDGSFEFADVPAGAGRVSARARGFAVVWKPVQIAARSVAEVELTLETGGIVHGRIRGLSQEQLGRCQVSGGGVGASPSADGTFTLEGVRPGRAEVSASLFPEGLHRAVPVEIADIAVPVEVEIDFSSGIAISGSVRRAGRPALGLVVQAAASARGAASTVTDDAGRFEMRGVEPGTLTVSVADDFGRTLASRTITAESDVRVDLEVPAGQLAGRVVAAGSREPIVEARVTAQLQGEALGRNATTGDDGSFRLEELPDGSYTVRAEASGYGSAEVATALSMGRMREVVLELPAEQGLILTVRQPDGSVPTELFIQPMRGGRVEDGVWARCDRRGTVRVTSLPPGPYVLLVRGGQGAAVVPATVPSAEIGVRLETTGRLDVLTPAAPGWRVRVATAAGLVVPPSPWQAPRRDGWHEVGTGRIELTLPAGSYLVEAVGPAVGVEQKGVVVGADGRASVAFE